MLWNAGVCFESGRSLQTAIRMFDMLERFYPKSKLTARSIVAIRSACSRYFSSISHLSPERKNEHAGAQDLVDGVEAPGYNVQRSQVHGGLDPFRQKSKIA